MTDLLLPTSYSDFFAFAPVVKGRPRSGKGGRVYTPKATREFEERVNRWYNGPMFEGDLAVTISLDQYRFFVSIDPLDYEPYWNPRGDLDNYGKAVLDGLQVNKDTGHGAYANDRQVKDLRIRLLS